MPEKSVSNDYVLKKAKEAIEAIKSYLDMEPKIQIEKVVVLKDRGLLKENRNYGARYVKSERKLIVYPFEDEKLLNFVIVKELFNVNLPDSVSNVRIARDLGWEFARLITKVKDKSILNLWKKCCKTVDVEGTKYVGYKDLPSLSTVSNGLFLKRLFWILKSFDKYNNKITRNDLGKIIHELAMDLSYSFSKEELLIVNFLLENPSATIAELAETFGGQYSSLYRKYKKLVDNKIISQQKRVSIAKIGLIPVLVWAEGIKPNSKVYNRLKKKDFLFSIFHYFDYEGGSIFTYAAPKNKEIKKRLKVSISDLRKATHMDINIFFPDYHYTNTSLSYYIPEEKTWVFSQDSWSRWADLVFSSPDIISSELTSLEFFNLRNVPLFKITALDMQIIREV
ncbi:MAG: hypothetical protein J7L47_05835 [Candidatus Odinarchaeota archaeon]|nr:hypothetical protein [Candidatus Odinarchaeota archaeon]